MKNIIKVLLLATVFLFIAGNINAQVSSRNGEFNYSYISDYTLVTGLGDTIYTGAHMPDGINDEGHPYSDLLFEGQSIRQYYSDPWIQPQAAFVEYNSNGSRRQSLIFKYNGNKVIYLYMSYGKEKIGLIKNNDYSKALSLWKD